MLSAIKDRLFNTETKIEKQLPTTTITEVDPPRFEYEDQLWMKHIMNTSQKILKRKMFYNRWYSFITKNSND